MSDFVYCHSPLCNCYWKPFLPASDFSRFCPPSIPYRCFSPPYTGVKKTSLFPHSFPLALEVSFVKNPPYWTRLPCPCIYDSRQFLPTSPTIFVLHSSDPFQPVLRVALPVTTCRFFLNELLLIAFVIGLISCLFLVKLLFFSTLVFSLRSFSVFCLVFHLDHQSISPRFFTFHRFRIPPFFTISLVFVFPNQRLVPSQLEPFPLVF